MSSPSQLFLSYDDAARVVSLADGSSRAYTPEESAAADARAQAWVDPSARAAKRDALKLIVTDLQAEKSSTS